MCFSAAASFAVGSVLLLLGACSLALVLFYGGGASSVMTRKQKAALATVAAIPLIFGLHQLSEGFVWKDFDSETAVRCFSYTAYVFWPFYISLSFALVEWTRRFVQHDHWSYWPFSLPDRLRRNTLIFHVVLATVLLAFVLAHMVPIDPDSVNDVNGRLQYEGWGIDSSAASLTASVAYAYVVVASMIVSKA